MAPAHDDAERAPAPVELPVVCPPAERRDAAANRARILAAAHDVLDEHGAAGLSMNAVALRAGVGKGTIFRRFGDREGLLHTLLDEQTATLQDGFLTGPPPLGPGVPPAIRLEAFVTALLALQDRHLELMLAADSGRHPAAPAVQGTFIVHVATLLSEIDPSLDAPVVAGLVLNAIAPREHYRLRRTYGASLADLRRGALALLRGLTAPCGTGSWTTRAMRST